MIMENPKKIGTLTFHVAHNYGAMLQAYALPKAVESLGYSCEVIHYCFPYIYEWGHVQKLPELCRKHGVIGGGLRYVKRLLKGTYNPKRRENKFERFIYDVMPVSRKEYHSPAEMSDMDYDAILFGSDQIWNAKLTGGIATEFVGGFHCLEKTRKIAYAASCGRSSFNQEEKDAYYPLLKDFCGLGIREQGFCQSLCDDGFPAKQVLDPTLLLTKEKWREMVQKTKYKVVLPVKPYLLVYVFDEDPSVYKLVDALSEEYGLEVCVICYQMKDEIKGYHIYDNCGPADFVRLFADATMVVTTSFHGTVFSVLFERDFLCVPHPTLHERTDSLLSLLGLDDRNYKPDINILERTPIDWSQVGRKLREYRNASLQFIKEAIE